MIMQKLSKFNFFVQRKDGNYTVFNSTSGAMGIMKPDMYQFCNGIEEKDVEHLNKKEKKYLETLKMANFIVDNDLDENKEVGIFMNSRKHDMSILGLTIMPTSRCNLDCTYCYEKKYNHTMDEKTKEALLEFAEERMYTVKTLDVTWYGGEPLLELDTIVDLSERFKALAEKHGASYSAGIITNGTLLTKKTAEILRDQCDIRFCQVTLDGPPEIHNKRRPFISDKGDSFTTIISNIKEVADILNINIRANIDYDNVEKINELLDILEQNGLKDKLNIHLGLTEPLGVKSQCPDTVSKCLDDEAMPEIQVDFYKAATDRGFSPQFYLVPSNVYGLCAAEFVNAYVIEPNGDVQKCWVTVGDSEERVGNVFEGIPVSSKLQKWIGFNPLEIEECKECKVLPLCWGNCIYRSSQKVDGLHCGMWKYELEKVLSQVEDIEDKIVHAEQGATDLGMSVISPTFGVRNTISVKLEDEGVQWLYKGTRSKKRCCFIVCVRCSHLSGGCTLGSCKPVEVSTKK